MRCYLCWESGTKFQHEEFGALGPQGMLHNLPPEFGMHAGQQLSQVMNALMSGV